MTIGEDCLVDLSPWQEFLIREAPLQRHCSRSWWRLAQTVVDADLRAPLTELLAIMRKNGGGCYAQLLMGVSRGMDKMANKLCQNPDSDTINFRVQFASGMVAGLDSQQAYSIARYVNSAQAITEDMQFCAIASDKAPVRGTNLTNSCITMVDNTCIVLPPMALPVERNFHVWEASALLVRPGYRRRPPPPPPELCIALSWCIPNSVFWYTKLRGGCSWCIPNSVSWYTQLRGGSSWCIPNSVFSYTQLVGAL